MKAQPSTSAVPPTWRLAAHRWGRVVLHLGCLVVHPTHLAHWRWHWQGISRELTVRGS